MTLEERVARLEESMRDLDVALGELRGMRDTVARFNAMVARLEQGEPDWLTRLGRLEEQMRVMRETLTAYFGHRLPPADASKERGV